MIIEELTIKNFRNYSNQKILFSPGINFILGPNGAGKTNILEAISITANMKSFRNIQDTEIIQWGKEAYHCASAISDSDDNLFEVGCGYVSGKIKKKAKIDSVEIKSISDYYGKLLITVFSPVDINIINNSPDTRRRFFDSVISKMDRSYLAALTEFKKILASRNRLLKELRDKGMKASSQLDVWDSLFAEKAAVIIQKRIAFLQDFAKTFEHAYNTISNDDEAPEILYLNSTKTTEQEHISQKLAANRRRDLALGSTGIGPQRDDFLLQRESVHFVNYASQGQKRTAAISLKLAECEITEYTMKKKSIILVDDIFSELDIQRRENMVEILRKGNQVIFTMVNSNSIDNYNFNEYNKLIVNNNCVEVN